MKAKKARQPSIKLLVVDCRSKNQGRIYDGVYDNDHFIGIFEAYSDEAYVAIKAALNDRIGDRQ